MLLFKILSAVFLTITLVLFFCVLHILRKNRDKKLKDIEAPLLLLIWLIAAAAALFAASCLGIALTN